METLLPERLRALHVGHRSGYVAAPRTRQLGAHLNLLARRKDGSEFPVEISLSPVRAGGALLVMCAIRDVSERRRAEEARLHLAREQTARAEAEATAERMRRLQAVTDTALASSSLDELLQGVAVRIRQTLAADLAIILLLSEDGRELELRAVDGVTDVARALTFRAPIGEGMPGRIAVERLPLLAADLSGSGDFPVARRLGIRSAIAVPLRVESRLMGVLGVGTRRPNVFSEADLDLILLVGDRIGLAIQQASLYERERQARAALEESGRVKDEFLSTAAHELKTPISVVKVYTHLLSQSMPAEASDLHRRSVEVLSRQCDRLTRLVQDLLEVSRLSTGRFSLNGSRVDLAAMAREAAERTRQLAPRHTIAVAGVASARIEADADRMDQVLDNLLSNAVKFSPDGGPIRVGVHVENGEVSVSVQDEGVGIPADRQRQIFERFYRAHDPSRYHFEGMGLGLYLSREIVRRHGGRMWFTSTEGEGSTFWFTVPLADDNEAEAPG